MISKLKIALLQIAPCKTLEENLEKGIVCCRKAKERGANYGDSPDYFCVLLGFFKICCLKFLL